MKKYLYLSVAALALASCSNDEFLGTDQGPGAEKETGAYIAFGTEALNATRAQFEGSAAAEKLNNNFIVYGFKTNNATEAIDGTTDQKVFDLYNVNYAAGTANTTESNTKDWEYVGFNNVAGVEQTIKYWDLSAKNYVFSAVSGLGITATKIESVTSPSTIYDKGWNVAIPAGGDLSSLYASDRVVEAPAKDKIVNLTFRALGTKIRFAMYETVPGYEVHIDKFYYNDSETSTPSWKNTETNFAIDGTFKTAKADDVTPLTITYYDVASGIENRPKVTYNDGDVASANYGIFGANIQATPAIGTTSVEATYDQSDKSYTMILPYESTAGMDLYVDYTLTSTDGSGETIKVKHASAKVPTNFVQWKPNFAYTYIFKISDNTNGTTGDPNDPDDPTSTPTDPEGLFPITFDAVVITDETDVQETITSVSDPSITTYQEGVVVTKNDEYKAGDIYFENDAKNIATYHVYEVNNYGTEATTEEVVANWKNNFCVLTEVVVKKADGTTNDGKFIPLSDDTYLVKDADEAAKFTAVAGKTYAIANDDAASATQWKVVKVAGGPASVTTALSATTGTITAANGVATVALTQNSVAAIGAKKTFEVKKGTDVVTTQFNITDNATAGSYDLQFTDEAIHSGAANNATAGTYTVNMLDEKGAVLATVDFTVTLPYVLAATFVDIEAGDATGEDTTLKIASTATKNAVIVNDNKGITITDNADGTYTVTADATVKNGAYIATIAGETLTINVANYQFDAKSYVYNMTTAGALVETGKVTLQTYEETPATATGVAGTDITITSGGSSSDAITLTGAAGEYTVGLKTAGAGNGTYTLTKANTAAEATVVINKYTMNNVSIKKATGIETLTIQANGKTINASKSNLVITDSSSADVTSNFTVSTNGSTLTLSSVKSTLTAGTYTATYYLEGAHTNAIATSTITVTD